MQHDFLSESMLRPVVSRVRNIGKEGVNVSQTSRLDTMPLECVLKALQASVNYKSIVISEVIKASIIAEYKNTHTDDKDILSKLMATLNGCLNGNIYTFIDQISNALPNTFKQLADGVADGVTGGGYRRRRNNMRGGVPEQLPEQLPEPLPVFSIDNNPNNVVMPRRLAPRLRHNLFKISALVLGRTSPSLAPASASDRKNTRALDSCPAIETGSIVNDVIAFFTTDRGFYSQLGDGDNSLNIAGNIVAGVEQRLGTGLATIAVLPALATALVVYTLLLAAIPLAVVFHGGGSTGKIEKKEKPKKKPKQISKQISKKKLGQNDKKANSKLAIKPKKI